MMTFLAKAGSFGSGKFGGHALLLMNAHRSLTTSQPPHSLLRLLLPELHEPIQDYWCAPELKRDKEMNLSRTVVSELA
jgi:hypothetical protein